jgi:hypothetical protein
MEVTRSFYLPQDFIIACELFQVKPAELLQSFIQHISVYGVFNNHHLTEEPQAIASIFSQNYFLRLNDTRPKPCIPLDRKALHLKYIQPILLSIHRGVPLDGATYRQLILDWYEEIKTSSCF